MGFFDRSNESASPIGLLRAHIGTFMYCVKMGKKKFQNKEDVGDIFFDMDQTKFLLDQATRGSLYDFRQRIDSALWDAAVHKYSEDLDKLKKALLKAVDQGAAKAADTAEEEPEEIVPEKEEEKSGNWRDHILDEMKEAEEAAKNGLNLPSKPVSARTRVPSLLPVSVAAASLVASLEATDSALLEAEEPQPASRPAAIATAMASASTCLVFFMFV